MLRLLRLHPNKVRYRFKKQNNHTLKFKVIKLDKLTNLELYSFLKLFFFPVEYLTRLGWTKLLVLTTWGLLHIWTMLIRSKLKAPRQGLCSTWLSRLSPGHTVPLLIRQRRQFILVNNILLSVGQLLNYQCRGSESHGSDPNLTLLSKFWFISGAEYRAKFW